MANINDYIITDDMTDLEKLRRRCRDASIGLLTLNNDDNEHLLLSLGFPTIMDTEAIKILISELQKTLDIDGIDEWIKKENKKRLDGEMISAYSSSLPKSDGKRTFPFESLRVSEQMYDAIEKERNWGFTCSFCGEKVSTKNSSNGIIEYISISPNYDFSDDETWIRACTIGCAKGIVKEYILKWINKNNYQDYFNIHELDDSVSKYFLNKCFD